MSPMQAECLKQWTLEAGWALEGQIQFLRHEARKHVIKENKPDWDSSWDFSPSSTTIAIFLSLQSVLYYIKALD